MPQSITAGQSHSWSKFDSAVRWYLSNLKWLSLSIVPLARRVKNWPSVFLHYSSPFQRRPILITFRNGETLLVPKNYLFEAIAETLLLNVYRFNESSTPRVV